jgi:hypothetical protein
MGGGAKFLKGSDTPRRFAPGGGGEYPRNIAPLLGGRISWGGGRISCDTGSMIIKLLFSYLRPSVVKLAIATGHAVQIFNDLHHSNL